MSHFFAYLEKMRFIKRWGLMRNTCEENIQEHSYQVATIAHALAMIRRKVFDRPVDIEKVLVCALYHDVSEVITGDLATPIKTFNPRISEVFGELGEMANRRLVDMVPEDLRGEYESLLLPDPDDSDSWELVRAADRISSYIKCIAEIKMGNSEFSKAIETVRKKVENLDLPEADYFVEKFLPSFSLTLDELN